MSRIAKDPQTYTASKEPITFNATFSLVREANPKAKAWPETADAWKVEITSDYPGAETFDYYTGIGIRMGRKPTTPKLRDVLTCLGSDLATALDMPLNDADACQHLADEYGYEKIGEVVTLVHDLRINADKLRRLLRHTGIRPDEFAEWCQSLDV